MRAVPAACLDLIHEFEQGPTGGFAAHRYLDPVGKPTIGWGHLLLGPSDTLWNATLIQEQADALAIEDLTRTANGLWVTLGNEPIQNLTDNQWAATLDFTFNEGIGHFKASTFCHFIQTGALAAAAKEFPKWIYGGNPPRALAGLMRRRAAEESLWNTP